MHRRGIPAIEGMLVARGLMYSSVYFHKTVRIAELMLSRAVDWTLEHEKIDVHKDIQTSVDAELLMNLYKAGGFSKEIVNRLKFRKLFKKIYSCQVSELSEAQRECVSELTDYDKLREKEQELCSKAKIPEGYAIIDFLGGELSISEPRIKKTQIKILDKALKPLSKYSPLAKALQLRTVPDWDLMVIAERRYAESLIRAIPKIVFG